MYEKKREGSERPIPRPPKAPADLADKGARAPAAGKDLSSGNTSVTFYRRAAAVPPPEEKVAATA